ncbi:alpha/beta fold hydrolase [Streptomyces sp. NPDC056121]|uniref:alpha/beta fold hydrolase n=1 Tax=Streptomyces TaxID=1883 RepID=UPI001D0B679A|nr:MULTISPECIES: alpha/beta fold hydrolase [Streptomyces]MCX5086431.1 alpha/beta hydrolase [Streptomyces sp. NBC_00401]UDM02519.1 alpha/beta hydrolase [Streptomyces longhuiensis]
MSEFHTQRPTWSLAPGDDQAEYATIEVPRDYADPGGERITLALSRRRATDPARRRGILLAVNGGPGGDWGHGRDLPAKFAGTPLNEVYDLIGFDPRGTGESTRLYAEVAVPTAQFDSRPPDGAFAELAEDMRLREEACARGGGELRPHISTRNTARDLDVIRAVLGEDRISFVGYAYGAYVGAVYGSLFPAALDRLVLDSCVGPDWTWREQFLWQGDAVQRNVDLWARWAGERHGHFGIGASAEAVLTTVEEVVAALEKLPEDAVRLRTLFDGAVGNRASDRGQWDGLAVVVAGLHEKAVAGDLDGCRELLAAQGTWRPADSEGDLRVGVLEAITLEHAWPSDLEVYYRDMREFRKRFPYGYGVLRAQPWVGAFRAFEAPEKPVALTRDGYGAGLIVQADGDPMDHYAGGVAMAERLGHHLLTVEDSGEHEVYVLGGNPHVDAVVHRYLVDGELPPARSSVPGRTPRPDIAADTA